MFAVIIGVLPVYADKFIILVDSKSFPNLFKPSKTTIGSTKVCIVPVTFGCICGYF